MQNLSYTWDTAGNLKVRQDLRQGISETADYDELNRMWRTVGPAGTSTFGYDAVGNITSRSDAGASTSSPTGGTYTWTSANLPATLTSGSLSAQFAYAPDRSRWRQIADYPGGAETTLYIGGLLEKHTTPIRTHWRHLIATPSGEVQHVRRDDGSIDTFYLPSDHVGSADAVLNAAATVLVRTSFDAWGGRRDDDWNGAPSSTEYQQIAGSTRHGFTGHEMLDNIGLVHMNGRVYDPASARFLSADPYVVPMLGTQGFNRYAYVGNQPLSYVDPSGFSPINPNNPDDDDGWDFDICIFGCGLNPGILGDRGRNPGGGQGGGRGWSIVDGDTRNNPRNGGHEVKELFASSVTADSINVSTSGGIFYQPLNEPLRLVDEPDPASVAGRVDGTFNMVGDGLAYNNRMWGYWKGKNGKWYPDSHHPNGATGARSVVFKRAAAWKFFGTAGAFATVGISGTTAFKALANDRPQDAVKPGIDIGVVGWSAASGPPGWVAGTGYFVIDATIGWGPALDSMSRNIEANRRITGDPNWVPWARE